LGDFGLEPVASNLVDLADLNLVLFNWNEPGANLPTGSPDGWTHQGPGTPGNSEPVSLTQLNLVLFNWNESGPTTVVPKPTTLVLLLGGWLSVLAIRRRFDWRSYR